MDFKLNASESRQYDLHRPPSARGPACHAPTNSLFIGTGGTITACCSNRSHVLGCYPAQSLEEAWRSLQRLELEQAIAAGDLSKGCQVCYQTIRSGNYAGLPAQVYDTLSPPVTGYPRQIDFELSNKCNLECIMCRGERSSSIRRNREHLPPIEIPYDAEFLRQLDAFLPHLERALFLGGEPFMIPIYLEIWERMMQLNPKVEISVQTNATRITDRVKKILESMRFSIAVSIDAIDPELYAAIRVNGKLHEVEPNIDYLRDYCQRKGTTISLSYTPMTRNWHELPDVVRWCNARNLPLFFNTLSYPRSLALKELPASQLASIVEFLDRADLEADSPIALTNRETYLNMVEHVRYWYEEALTRPTQSVHRLADDLDAYFELFAAYLQTPAGEGFGAETYAEIRAKIERVLTTMESLGKYEAVRDFILTVEFAAMLRFVPAQSEAELITGMQTVLVS